MGVRLEALKALYALVGSGSIGVVTQAGSWVDNYVRKHESLFEECLIVENKKPVALQQLDEYLREYSPEWALSVGFPYIIPEETLSLPVGFLNVHPHLLPKWPGANAIRESHARGEGRYGATLHHMVPEVDAGPIIEQFGYDGKHLELPEIYDWSFSVAEPYVILAGLQDLFSLGAGKRFLYPKQKRDG